MTIFNSHVELPEGKFHDIFMTSNVPRYPKVPRPRPVGTQQGEVGTQQHRAAGVHQLPAAVHVGSALHLGWASMDWLKGKSKQKTHRKTIGKHRKTIGKPKTHRKPIDFPYE